MFTELAKKMITEGKIIRQYKAINADKKPLYAFELDYQGKRYIIVRRKNGVCEMIARQF